MIWDWLRPAIERGGMHSVESVIEEIKAGRMQLWHGPDGAAVTQVVDFPQKRVLHVLFAGGSMEQIIDFQDSAAEWGKAQGCTEMTLSGRKGWVRALKDHGWKPKDVVMEKAI